MTHTIYPTGDLKHRQAGVLLAISSLPGNHGIGDFGQCAYDFIDLSAEAGFQIWQILPLNPSSGGNSPYTPYSSYAGDEIYISLDLLTQWHLLEEVPSFEKEAEFVDYDKVRQFKRSHLMKAFHSFQQNDQGLKEEYETFVKGAFWLEGYARFMALTDKNDGKAWSDWPQEDQNCHHNDGLEEQINYYKFVQYIFIKQFNIVKIHAHSRGISIMGDMPIYVSHNSADVFENRECFQLDDHNMPLFVSGAAPDYFSQDGQLWGHPIYDWEYLKETDYDFWVKRFKWNNEIFDILRIDHFRAFDTYWSVPAGEETARNGKWIEGPSYHFFDSIYRQLPELNIIVEDLGDLRHEVHLLRDHYGLIGMRIIQFSFGETEERENFVIPQRCVAYCGTHDNATIRGWFESLSEYEQGRIRYIMHRWDYPEKTIPEQIVHRTFGCEAIIAVCMIQDLLNYDDHTRFNVPGTVGSPNWCWKLTNFDDYRKKVADIYQILEDTDRL